MPILYLNGRFLEHMDASLDPLDRGVLLGDGLFETVRCEEGQLLFHLAHYARLGRNARRLEIPWNMNAEDLLAICQQVLDANDLKLARLRITLTRGEGSGGPDLVSGGAPTLIVHAQQLDQGPIDEARQRGWSGAVASFPINHRSPLAEVKSTSYQEHLLARHFARRDGFDEALLLNTDGLLAEGAMANLFIVRGNDVVTPPVGDGALPGIMRRKIGLICGRFGYEYGEESLTLEHLENADEAFLTNAIMEVMPLVRVGSTRIGDGQPGPAVQQLFHEHRRDVEMFLHQTRGG